MKTPLINDSQHFTGARNKFGSDLPTYDDGYGPLWVMRDSMGICGIVRATSWEEAWEICQDEIFPEASDTIEEMEKDFSTIYKSGRDLRKHLINLPEKGQQKWLHMLGRDVPFDSANGGFSEHPCWQEAYGFRPNGPNATDILKHGIYAKDLNGEELNLLTQENLDEWGITLEIAEEDTEN